MKILTKSLDIASNLFEEQYKHHTKYRVYHYAFLYRRNKLLSMGTNEYTDSSKALYFGKKFGVYDFQKWKCIHAEIDCLSKVWGKIHIDSSFKIVILRLNKKGLQQSKPCSNCQTILDAIGIHKIFYSKVGGFNV